MIKADTSSLRAHQKQMKVIQKKALPYAVRNTLNDVAFVGKKLWSQKLKANLTLKNTYTLSGKNLRVDKAKMGPVSRMHSVLGAREDYMADIEFGKKEQKKGQHGVPIPTTVAAGQGRGRKQTRVVRQPHQLPNISLMRRAGKTPRQRNAIAINQAVAKHRRYVFLELKDRRRTGIFRITMGASKFKTPYSVSGIKDSKVKRLDMLWSIARTSVTIEANPILGKKTLPLLMRQLPRIYMRNIQKQLQFHRLAA